MKFRLALMSVALCVTAYGCATPEQPATAGAAAPQQSRSAHDYRTGSRLPSLEDDRGPGYVGGQSKQDYQDDMNSRTAPMRSN